MTIKQATTRVNKLRQEIDHHRYLYHVLDTQEISDAALDSLKKELAQLESDYPKLVIPTSPTQRVGGAPLEKFNQINHSTPMLSLQDTFSIDDIKSWEERNTKIVPGPYQYFVQSKIDGVALALVYQDGQLQSGITRGDGRVGEDVTHNIRTIEAIPLVIRQPIKGRLEVRGEVYMLKEDFDRLNKQRAKAKQPPFANPRNVSAGSIRQLDPNLAAARPLRFMAWEITQGTNVATRAEEYELLQTMGFPVPPGAKVFKSLAPIATLLGREETKRDKYPYLVDGAVLKINDLATSRRLGVVGKAPRGSIAFKYAAEEATTVVESIVVQVGRTGALTPVAHLKPVAVAGSTVSRASLHNADEIKRKDVRVGDTVIIRKAGDIIPEVVQPLIKLRPPGTRPFSFPTKCPVCGTPVKRENNGTILRCSNANCFPQQRERIIHAISQDAFDIDGLGDKIIEQLLQTGLIKDAPDLWNLTAGDLTPLERFAAKSASNVVSELKKKKAVSLPRFIIALGIPNVGTVTAQDIAREFSTLTKLRRATVEELESINGIGAKVAQGIHQFLTDSGTKELIARYQEVGIKVATERATGSLIGQTFVFTGSLPDMTRDEAKHRVLAAGGKVASTAGANVDYVVVGKDAGSKAAKAKELGIKTLTAKQFKKMLNK